MTTKERLAVEMEERERCVQIVQRHINFWSIPRSHGNPVLKCAPLLADECRNILAELTKS